MYSTPLGLALYDNTYHISSWDINVYCFTARERSAAEFNFCYFILSLFPLSPSSPTLILLGFIHYWKRKSSRMIKFLTDNPEQWWPCHNYTHSVLYSLVCFSYRKFTQLSFPGLLPFKIFWLFPLEYLLMIRYNFHSKSIELSYCLCPLLPRLEEQLNFIFYISDLILNSDYLSLFFILYKNFNSAIAILIFLLSLLSPSISFSFHFIFISIWFPYGSLFGHIEVISFCIQLWTSSIFLIFPIFVHNHFWRIALNL